MSAEDLWRVRAPEFTPKWLRFFADGADRVDVDASALSEDIAKWPKLQRQLTSRTDELGYVSALADPSGPLTELLDAMQLRHEESPVWWVGLDSGPQFVASLWDLVVGTVLDEKYRTIGVCPQVLGLIGSPIWGRYGLTPASDRVYLMSLAQWDSATWPAESEEGPPYTKHVSVYR